MEKSEEEEEKIESNIEQKTDDASGASQFLYVVQLRETYSPRRPFGTGSDFGFAYVYPRVGPKYATPPSYS